MSLRSINPATGELIAEYEGLTGKQIGRCLARAESAFADWRGTPLQERAGLLRRAAELLRERKARYGALITDEMGKIIASAENEVEKCAGICEYYADNGARFLEPETIETDAGRSFIRFDPIGPVLAVMPWNMPFWMPLRSAVPALMAGNVMLLKHASNVSGSSLAVEGMMLDAGFPEGVFQSLLIGSPKVAQVLDDPRVRAVTLTGSAATGSKVAERAGRLIKKSVLELGGSDAFIVLADADLARAAQTGVRARIFLAGQACIAAKRFVVNKQVAGPFSEKLRACMAALKIGDPRDRDVHIGPLARADLVDKLDAQVQRSIAQGAECILGGRRLDGPGCFYEPTILTGVTKGMPAYDEETFGPVAAIVEAEDDDDAIAIANDSSYGLGSSLWSRDAARAEELAGRIEAGMVFINGLCKSDPRLPFGGVKNSGYGRECARYGMLEFVNIKSVWIA